MGNDPVIVIYKMNTLPENITFELIVAYLKGEAAPDESLLMQQWINAAAENKDWFNQLKTIWIETGKLDPVPVDVNVDAAWEKLATKIDSGKSKTISISKKKKPADRRLYTLLKVAAVLIPAIIVLYLYFFTYKEVKQTLVVTTEKAIQKKLPDGSIVKMNVRSELTFPETFAGDIREVHLVGEAFFDVAPDKEKPFIIHSKEAFIEVVGTSFNVNAYNENEDVEVIVSTGKVLLYGVDKKSGDINSVVLEAGTNGVFSTRTGKITKVLGADENEMFWITRTLVFNKTELSEVVKVLSKHYKVSIVLKSQELNTLRLSATFKDQSVASVLDIIATSFNLKVTQTNTAFEIDEIPD